MDVTRCIRANEYSDPALASLYGDLDEAAIETLKDWPCLFAYEGNGPRTPGTEAPKFGFIRRITRKVVRGREEFQFEYETREIKDFLSAKQLFDYGEEIGIDLDGYEMTRTHWAVKNVELPAALRRFGIVIPPSRLPIVDLKSHVFDVALSFPGEARGLVEEVAKSLAELIGKDSVFYDMNFQSQLARPNLDTLLQDIYRNRSNLVVVFLSSHYQLKDWCGVEFRAIRDIIKSKEDRVMFVRTDEGVVDGVFRTDGYIDARVHGAKAIAHFIRERADLNHLLSS